MKTGSAWTKAVGRAYAAHRDGLLGYLRKLGVPDSGREDALHDAAVLTVGMAPTASYREIDAVRLLNSACLIMARRHYVKSRREPSRTLTPVETETADNRMSMVAHVNAAQTEKTIERAVRALAALRRCPTNHAVAMMSGVTDGLTLREIGGPLDLRENAVQVAVFRIRRWMRADERRNSG